MSAFRDNDPRVAQAERWLEDTLTENFEILPLADDASFRRYFRVHSPSRNRVLMDAPPDKENIHPFVSVQGWMHQVGLHVPAVLASHIDQGFLLLEDLGDQTWAVYLKAGGRAADLIPDAFRQLHALRGAEVSGLPEFNRQRMHTEFDLYLDWYLPKVANRLLSDEEKASYHQALDPFIGMMDDLEKVPVHLDFHSRNLMVLSGNRLGVIDFQDAVHGPLTYDLASLLYDCYQDYPEAQRADWSRDFFSQMDARWQEVFGDFDAWHYMLRLTALQRHIKAIGIFSRLAHRDGKTHFLDEIPLTRKHLLEAMPLFDFPDDLVQLLSVPPAQ